MTSVSVVMVVKNEEENIPHSLPPLISHFDDVHVVDSHSNDKTAEIAKNLGATVHQFEWNGQYPKKRQWCLDNLPLKHEWVFMVDADEIMTDNLAEEIKTLQWHCDGYFVGSDMVWNDKHLKYGYKNNKLCLFKKSAFAFPILDDLDFEGMGEIEGHYQPVPTKENETISQIKSRLLHHDHKDNWKERHDRYIVWEKAMNKRNAWPIDPIFKRELIKDFLRTNPLRPHIIFVYGYILKGGFLDGKEGLDYALNRYRYAKAIINDSHATSNKRKR